MEKLTEEKIEELKEWEKEWEDLKEPYSLLPYQPFIPMGTSGQVLH